MQWHRISGISGLRPYRELWNQLWASGHAAQPTSTAEGIETWCRHFGSGREFVAIVAESDERLVAALPLLRRTKLGLPIYELPTSCWANSGDLLVDPTCSEAAIRTLVDGLRDSISGLLRLEEIAYRAPRWQALFRSLKEAGGIPRLSQANPVGYIDQLTDWDAYEATLAGSFRRSNRRLLRRLNELGEISVRHLTHLPDDEVEPLLKSCFEIEDRGWKGQEGTSVLQTPGMYEYFVEEAKVAAAKGFLEVWLLELDQTIMAFEYCHVARGCCYSHKLSFDPEYAKYGPGRVLRRFQLEHYAQDPDVIQFDMLGVLCDTKRKWSNRTYETGTCVISTRSPLSHSLLQAYNLIKPPVAPLSVSD